MALDFLPFREGQVLKAEDLNALVTAIQDGTIFLNTSYISEQLSNSGTRISGLESRVTYLESLISEISIREQFSLSSGQSIVGLSKTPNLDTELIFLNGLSLSKSGVPNGFIGDYSISGSTITFNTELASQIEAGDMLVVKYSYEA